MTNMRNYKYFDKTALVIAAKIAKARDYNRQLDVAKVEADLSDEQFFPVSFSMLHEHAGGVKVDPHVRCIIVINSDGDTVMLDVDMGLYNGLPEWEVDMDKIEREAQARAAARA